MTSILSRAIKLHQSGKLDQAAALYRKLLTLDPKHAKALQMLGVVFSQQGKYMEAVGLVSQSIALDALQSDAHHNLALMYQTLGNFAEAEHHYRRAVALNPEHAAGYFNLMSVKKFTPEDAVISSLEQQLMTIDQRSLEDQSFLHFAAGKLYKDLGRYDEAFSHYQQGNECFHAVYDRTHQENLVQQLIGICDRTYFAARSGWGDTSITPLFIVGMPRSGTTLAEQILATHKQVVALGELPDIPGITKALSSHTSPVTAYPQCLSQLSQDVFAGFAKSYRKRIQTLSPVMDSTLTLDKLPSNYLHLGLIVPLFPKAKIIHCRRHPLDVCLSCYFHRFPNSQDYSYNLEDLGHYYRTYQKLMEHWKAALPVPIFDLDYEVLVDKPEVISQKLFTFCGLDWYPECLANFQKLNRPVKTASSWQVRQPLYRTAVNQWQRYEAFLDPLKASLGL